ncbi:eCIS core domain-containing protein [Streptomyces abyssomicinicus]|uniref:eCIS core domain-containing protein n=1 Tax=Streptomyces abyssomicinicus TaxID=574929 RepID=UPI0012501F8B|nr:DUF4157 domain-containing protein [Streptomyces abyssomicinicus]
MSGSPTQDAHSEQAAEARRRKRKERAAKSRAPEPKDIVGGAGQPLDPGVRRELEEQLGHDLSRVRLHTDRDAGQLTALLGADAVAVGQDIFFREGAFAPGTTEGRRLLAHELLHTVQNPHGLGALRVGRELGAVSMPQQAIEREAESAAQALVNGQAQASQVHEVEAGQATPGWLRYATVDADRRRMEQLDPTTLVDRLANTVLRSLRGDPDDRSGRVRLQLARMSAQVQDIVFDRLETRLPTPVLDRLLEAVEETEEAGPLPRDAATAPLAVPGAADEVAEERRGEETAGALDGRERSEDTEGGSRTGGEGKQDEPGGDTKAGTGGGTGRAADSEGGASPEQVTSEDEEEAGAREQDRSESRQQDRASATREDSSVSAQGQRQATDEAQTDEPADEDSEAQEEAAQEPERQAGEQQTRRDEGLETVASTAPAPSPMDRSGAEPGEKPRTGGDSRPFRSMGDPENDQGVDDEPLGMESDSVERERVSDEGTPTAHGDEPVADIDLVGYTEAAKNPSLVEERRKGTAPRPSLPPTDAGPEPDTRDEESRPAAAREASAGPGPDDDSQGLTGQDLFTGASPDPGPAGADEATGAGGEGAWVMGPTASAGDVGDRLQTQQRAEDAEARRRDEEARTADGTATVAPPSAGEPAGPERLAKADEDARSQDSGAPRTSGPAADGGGQAGGAPAKGETPPGAGADSSPSAPTDRRADVTDGTRAGAGTDRGTQSSRPNPGTDSPDVTEGNGHATSPGPETGPDRVSTPGSGSAPPLAPGNGPSPVSAAEARTNAPRPSDTAGSRGGSSTRSKPKSSKGQAARQAARSARGGGGSGGGRSPSAPTQARGGSRRGASAPGKPRKETPAPDLSNATPETGLAAAAGLKPHQMLDTLKGVNGAVGRSVSKERVALRKAPPNEQRPTGSPRTVPGGPTPAAPGTYTGAKVARTEATPGRTPEITGERKPEGEVPGANMPEPSWWDIAVTIGAKLLGDLLKDILPLDDLIDSILGIPTKDEGLQNAKVGDAPRLPLENDSDPRRTDEQSLKLDERKTELHRSGREDAARPMGEDQIYPDVPRETLTGKVPGGSGKRATGGGRNMSGGGVPVESASAVAEHDRSPQIQAGFAQGRQRMALERRSKDDKALADRRKHDQDLKREVDRSSGQQADTRDKGRSDISAARDTWRKEQDDTTAEIDGKKGKKYDEVRKNIKDKEEQTDKDVDKRAQDDNKKITDEQSRAETEAEGKQQEGKDDADNWLEEAIEKLKQFFEDLKNAIKSVFEKARQFVTDVIDKFKQQVFKLIDDARNWVIDKINKFADALIALGDELLADYPAMRDKWRRTIDGARDWAVEKVNRFADGLKEIAGKLLDGLCRALVAGLDLLESGMLAAVEVAETATVGALEFGAAVVAGLGEWAAIFNDIVSDPGDWISKAGAAADTGAREHLFTEVTAAVRAWFHQKVQEIIGVPVEDFQELVSGGVTVEQMAQMAWDEALPQLPVIIGVLVVEKVVAKLIPGAGWVMAVIDALQTAWGALSEILAAFGLFMDFLKSVKSGNGAQPFAKAVAAGVVALLELIYEFLIEGVGRFMGKVTDKLGDLLKNLRKKKDGPDGPDAPPGQPDAPGKPKDRDSAPTNDDRSPDRPADRDDRPTPSRPTTNQKSRPPARPRPGKRSSPEKRRPSHTTRPRKRRDDERRREEGREVNAARKRIRDAERRTRDDKADGPGTPSRRRPGTDRTDSRGPGRDRPGDRRADDGRPTKDTRPDDRRTDDRRRDTDRDGDRPRRPGNRLRRARQSVKSAVSRARRAVTRLSGKARRRLGSRLNDQLRKLREQWRRRRDELGPDRTSDRGRDRGRAEDRQRENNGITDFDLPRVRFRTKDGEAHTLQFDGKGRNADLAVRSVLQDMAGYFGEWETEIAELKQKGKTDLADAMKRLLDAARHKAELIEARQNSLPKPRNKHGISRGTLGDVAFQRQIERLRDAMEILADLLEQRNSGDKEPPLPHTILPPFVDGPMAFNFKARFIRLSTPPGTEAQERKSVSAHPVGWKELERLPGGVAERGRFWVRMHMLPTKIGGHASTSNLVPALGAINTRAMVAIEHPAQAAIGHVVEHGKIPTPPEKMIWYQVSIDYRGRYPGFPRRVGVRYGGYRVAGNRWQEKSATGKWAESFPKPNIAEGLDIKKAKAAAIRMVTRVSDSTAQDIVALLKATPGKYNSVDDLAKDLQASAGNLTGGPSQRLNKDLAKLRAARTKITF